MRIFIVLLLSFASLGTQAQYKLEDAKHDLRALSESYILVRLQTKQKTIEALEKSGNTKKAKEVEQKLYQENKETILSFQQTFDFCPVYFFYAEDSDDIRNRNFEGKVFDAQLKTVNPSLLQVPNFYIAEFSHTPNLGISGLVLCNSNIIPLEAPFPFYEREYIFFSLIKRSKATMAEAYNKKLKNQYVNWFKSQN